MNFEGYTPSEVLEAEERKEKNETGFEQAKFYYAFITSVEKDIREWLKSSPYVIEESKKGGGTGYTESDKNNIIDTTKLSIKQLGISKENLDSYILNSYEKTAKIIDAKKSPVELDSSLFVDMIPQDFFSELEKLKLSLKKNKFS